MDLAVLKSELTTDPLTRGYAGMSDAEAAANLNTVNRTRNKTSMTGSEVINAVDAAEADALTDVQQRRMWDIVHLGEINPFGIEAKMLIAIFGAGSATITALAAARQDNVSRADELGLGVVREGEVTAAKAM